MNKQLRRVALVVGLLFFALLINLTYTAVVRQPSLEDNPRNTRAREADFDRQRGQILASATVVADTVPAPEGDEFTWQRVYTDGPLYAQVTGFFSWIYGTSGLEQSQNTLLSGTDSRQAWERLVDLASGRTPAGASITTTIDPVLQQAASDALGDDTGAVVALDPHTGAIKALVSHPSYDPSTLASHDVDAVMTAWESLLADPASPMSDRASREIYPPGSTFKVITAAAALEAGYTPDSLIDTPSELPYPNSNEVLTNSSDCGDSQVTLQYAFTASCNTAFANLGLALGAEELAAMASAFGFGTDPLDDLGAAASQFPDLDPSDPDEAAQLMRAAIGQGDVAASALQMAMVSAAVVNEGTLAQPYLVSEARAPDLSLLRSHQTETSTVMSQASAQTLEQLMIGVVEEGTGTPARIWGVTVGGKTGTAQSDPSRPPYAWFTGFATDPDLVVAVFVENTGGANTEVAGGSTAGPIARAVLQAGR
jgi:peptidoglycan glycosyltransferase